MPVAEEKQRVMVTLPKKSIAQAKAVLSCLGDAKMTLSDLIEVALGFFMESAVAQITKEQNAQKGNKDNA